MGRVDPDEITTEDWFVHWLDERVSDNHIGSLVEYHYREIIANHLAPAIGSVRLRDLRTAHVQDLKTALSETLMPATVRKILGFLHAALQSAVNRGLLASNPASAVVRSRPALLRISRNHVDELVQQGALPSVRLGRRILIPRDALDRFVARQQIMRQQTDGTDEETVA